jgi:hypothetical protein
MVFPELFGLGNIFLLRGFVPAEQQRNTCINQEPSSRNAATTQRKPLFSFPGFKRCAVASSRETALFEVLPFPLPLFAASRPPEASPNSVHSKSTHQTTNLKILASRNAATTQRKPLFLCRF